MNRNGRPMIDAEPASVHALRQPTPGEMSARRFRSLVIACGLGAVALSIWALAVVRWSGMIAGSGG